MTAFPPTDPDASTMPIFFPDVVYVAYDHYGAARCQDSVTSILFFPVGRRSFFTNSGRLRPPLVDPSARSACVPGNVLEL